MAQGRMLRKSIAYDERLAQLSLAAEYLYLKAIPYQDSAGRMLGRPSAIRGTVVPLRAEREQWDDNFIESLMSEWLRTTDESGETRPLVAWGAPRGIWVVEFNGFQKTQVVHGRERESELPSPCSVRATVNLDSRVDHELNRTEVETEANASLRANRELVYESWRKARGKTDPRYDRISDARRKKIDARLREFTADDLVTAIAAVALDPWEDRPRHDDLTIILRSREQVERFLELAERGPGTSTARPGVSATAIMAEAEEAAAREALHR